MRGLIVGRYAAFLVAVAMAIVGFWRLGDSGHWGWWTLAVAGLGDKAFVELQDAWVVECAALLVLLAPMRLVQSHHRLEEVEFLLDRGGNGDLQLAEAGLQFARCPAYRAACLAASTTFCR